MFQHDPPHFFNYSHFRFDTNSKIRVSCIFLSKKQLYQSNSVFDIGFVHWSIKTSVNHTSRAKRSPTTPINILSPSGWKIVSRLLDCWNYPHSFRISYISVNITSARMYLYLLRSALDSLTQLYGFHGKIRVKINWCCWCLVLVVSETWTDDLCRRVCNDM